MKETFGLVLVWSWWVEQHFVHMSHTGDAKMLRQASVHARKPIHVLVGYTCARKPASVGPHESACF